MPAQDLTSSWGLAFIHVTWFLLHKDCHLLTGSSMQGVVTWELFSPPKGTQERLCDFCRGDVLCAAHVSSSDPLQNWVMGILPSIKLANNLSLRGGGCTSSLLCFCSWYLGFGMLLSECSGVFLWIGIYICIYFHVCKLESWSSFLLALKVFSFVPFLCWRIFGTSEHGLCKGKELICRTTPEEQDGNHGPENELLWSEGADPACALVTSGLVT